MGADVADAQPGGGDRKRELWLQALAAKAGE